MTSSTPSCPLTAMTPTPFHTAINVKSCLYISPHITSLQRIVQSQHPNISRVNCYLFSESPRPPQPITRHYAMNSRASEHSQLHSSMAVDAGLYQRRLDYSGILRCLSQQSLASWRIGYSALHAIRLPANEPSPSKTSSILSRAIV